MKTFNQWLTEAKLVLPVVADSYENIDNEIVLFLHGHNEPTEPIVKLKNINMPDEQGRTQWEVVTSDNKTYHVAMDRKIASTLPRDFFNLQKGKKWHIRQMLFKPNAR